jgi:hypothetical protein
MAAIQDPITAQVASTLGMTPDEAESNHTKAARRAAAILKANGYTRTYCEAAWNLGMRWCAPGSTVAQDYCSTTMLGVALINGHIQKV